MKSMSVVLVFSISLACARADPAITSLEAIKKCGGWNLGLTPLNEVWNFIAYGEDVKLSREQKCVLHCHMQEADFFNDNGYLRNGSAYVKALIHDIPSLGKYSDVLMAQIFQVARTARSIEDKCERAFVVYQQISWTITTLRIARGIEKVTHTKDTCISVNTVEGGQSDDQETSKKLEQYFEFFDALINDEATWESMKGNATTRPFCKVAESMKILEPKRSSISHRSSTIKC
ncbi:uncharacterized protein LOC135839215 [Planococcus citri]|uniref:uncharacterized protein LOC135839215 n=1 Tax=Planococcus citri TaxID=170843 RepID=UPI0031F863CE